MRVEELESKYQGAQIQINHCEIRKQTVKRIWNIWNTTKTFRLI